jgi:hypothetical protein
MKLTKSKLKRIIKEELQAVLDEQEMPPKISWRVEKCQRDSDCLDGEICEKGKCEKIPEMPSYTADEMRDIKKKFEQEREQMPTRTAEEMRDIKKKFEGERRFAAWCAKNRSKDERSVCQIEAKLWAHMDNQPVSREEFETQNKKLLNNILKKYKKSGWKVTWDPETTRAGRGAQSVSLHSKRPGKPPSWSSDLHSMRPWKIVSWGVRWWYSRYYSGRGADKKIYIDPSPIFEVRGLDERGPRFEVGFAQLPYGKGTYVLSRSPVRPGAKFGSKA